jgi:hypothetical protein
VVAGSGEEAPPPKSFEILFLVLPAPTLGSFESEGWEAWEFVPGGPSTERTTQRWVQEREPNVRTSNQPAIRLFDWERGGRGVPTERML